MAREISLSFSLGAKLAGSYQTAFQQAASQAQNVARAIREMERTPVGTIGKAMEQQRASIKNLSTELRGAQAQLASLRGQAGAGGATGLLARQIELAEKRVNSLSGSLNRQLAAWRTTAAQAANTAGSVQGLSAKYAELAGKMERARKVQSALNAQQAQMSALRAQRDDMQSRLMGTVTGSTALGASVAVPVKLAISAEDTFADLRKVLNVPEEELTKLFADAQAMAAQTGKSFEDIVAIMTAAGQAGLGSTREQLLSVAEQATKMSIAWGVSAEQAGKSMATWQAAMGMTQAEAVHTADVINALSNAMNAEAGEIGQIFTRMGPLMKGTGFTADQTAALATAFKAAGAEVEVAGTAMKNMVKVMAAGSAGLTDQRKAIYGYLQIDPDQLQKDLQKDAMGAVMKVMEALQKVRPEERNSISSLLFGEESVAAISPLMTQLGTLKQAAQIAAGDVAGSVEAEYANRMKTAGTAVSQLTQSVRNLGITAGNALLPAVTSIAKGLTGVIGVVQGLVSRFPKLSGVIMGGVGVAAAFAAGSLALGLVMNGVRTAVTGLAGGLIRMNAAQLAAAAGSRTLSLTQGLSSLATMNWRQAITGAVSGISSLVSSLGAYIGLQRGATAATVAMTVAQRAQAGLATIVSGGFKLIGTAIRFAMGPLGLIMTALSVAAGLIIDNWATVGPFFQNLWNGIVGAFQAAWDVIQGIMQKIAGAVSWIGEAIDKIPVIGSAKRGIGKAIDAVFGGDEKKAPAAAAKEASAAPAVSAPVSAPAPKLAPAAAAKEAAKPDYFDKSYSDFVQGRKGAKGGTSARSRGGGSGGGGGSRAASSGGGGPVTVVSYSGDNKNLQTLFIPAGGRVPASSAVSAPSLPKPTALPSAPARAARVARQQQSMASGPRELTIDVSQSFDILSSDPQAAKKMLESIKPDMEALIRRALATLESAQRRTAYAQ